MIQARLSNAIVNLNGTFYSSLLYCASLHSTEEHLRGLKITWEHKHYVNLHLYKTRWAYKTEYMERLTFSGRKLARYLTRFVLGRRGEGGFVMYSTPLLVIILPLRRSSLQIWLCCLINQTKTALAKVLLFCTLTLLSDCDISSIPNNGPFALFQMLKVSLDRIMSTIHFAFLS